MAYCVIGCAEPYCAIGCADAHVFATADVDDTFCIMGCGLWLATGAACAAAGCCEVLATYWYCTPVG